MTPFDFFLFLAGLALLIVGAEALVRGSSRLAGALGITPLVIGLTVVAFGTSAPELAVSVRSAAAGQTDLAFGNVVGSNIFNVLFILGVSAIITPVRVARKLVRLDVPVMVGATFLLWFLAGDGLLSRPEGILLLAGLVAYTGFLVWEGRREGVLLREQRQGDSENEEAPPPREGLGFALALAAVGLALLVLGSRWLVDGAITIARAFGVGERVIGATLVAAGTSLPEVATSVVAAFRGERDIAVGNVVGSNAFNLFAVLGTTATVSAAGLVAGPGTLRFDLPVMAAVAVACLPVFFTRFEIDRLEGAVFLAAWVGYTVMLYRGDIVSPWPAIGAFLALVALTSALQLRSRDA